MLFNVSWEVEHPKRGQQSGIMPVEAVSRERAIEYAQHVLEEQYPGEENWLLLECEIKQGRPSQGRSERLQFNATPDLAEWLDGKRRERSEKSLSNVIFDLLEGLRNAE